MNDFGTWLVVLTDCRTVPNPEMENSAEAGVCVENASEKVLDVD